LRRGQLAGADLSNRVGSEEATVLLEKTVVVSKHDNGEAGSHHGGGNVEERDNGLGLTEEGNT
jgi:hypothetical protein